MLSGFNFAGKQEKNFKKPLTSRDICGIMVIPRMGLIFLCLFIDTVEPPFKPAIPRPREAIMPATGKKIGGAESES